MKKTVYWKRFDYRESGFKLVEILEDATLIETIYEHRGGDPEDYEAITKNTKQLSGDIVIEKLDIKNSSLPLSDMKKHLSETQTFAISDWSKARQAINDLQKESHDDLTVDYHSVLRLKDVKADGDVPALAGQYQYPIVPLRVVKENGTVVRKKHPEQLSIEFIPEINEHLYFHNMPGNSHVNMTGDDLFALDVKETDQPYDYEQFLNYIHTMLQTVRENLTHYKELIEKQRERRAMLETDEMGDLYPR